MSETLSYAAMCALPAGRRLDALITAALVRDGRSEHRMPRNAGRWSSDARLVCCLIAELSSPFWMLHPWTVTLRCAKAGTADRDSWHCTITGEHPTPWYCEGVGETLPLAFCRAFLQELEESHG